MRKDPLLAIVDAMMSIDSWANTWWGKIIRVPAVAVLFCAFIVLGALFAIGSGFKWFGESVYRIFIGEWKT